MNTCPASLSATVSPAAIARWLSAPREHLQQCSCRVLYSIKPHRFPLCLHQDFRRRESHQRWTAQMPRSTPWLQRMHISACTAAVHARQQSPSRHDSCPAQASGLSRPRVARPAGLQRCRAHGVLRDDATGAGKGVVADMDGVPARIWRQAHLARVGDALRTRRRSDAERLARAVEWHSEAFLRSTRRDPGPGRRSFLTNHRIIQVAATDPSGSPPEARVRAHVDSPMNTEAGSLLRRQFTPARL